MGGGHHRLFSNLVLHSFSGGGHYKAASVFNFILCTDPSAVAVANCHEQARRSPNTTTHDTELKLKQ